ncbi:membrane protease subunit HflK [Andreprevotia lacus DSM 23236]|jgi:membrane protease subunit HflK|uniref:Protein HflK n=1 Tax=Andreprevotia lacus DSM 23236 TaxID=1121001 RepID=A0A1W1XM62_9NEIS|nr:FtsH protease activity modulator HflK [Andreprevotia lacus]SMC24907.1 membrane protease subunit HflK [Andreprevotia lacus DSM 23236]
MSQNDPQWGGRRNGPPDLDDIFRSFKNKLSGLFGSNGNAPQTGRGGGIAGAGVVLIVLGTLWVASGCYVVDERENAVITRFGSYAGTVEKSGLNWHLPWPIERSEIVRVTEIRRVEVGNDAQASSGRDEAMMLTGDQNLVEVQLEIQFTIKSAKDFLFNNRSTETTREALGNDLVKQAAEAAIREVVGKNKVDFVLNEGRGKIGDDTKELMQDLLDKYGTGIQIARVNISDVQAPNEVQGAFADAVKARQDKARLINEGRAYANDVVPRASGMAARLNQEALGYKQQVVARAEGDASRFKQVASEYAKAPQVMRDRMYLDTMQEVFQNTTKVLVDQKTSGNLLYLPLDKLMQMSTNQEPAKPEAAAPAAAAPAAPVAAQTNPRAIEREGR